MTSFNLSQTTYRWEAYTTELHFIPYIRRHALCSVYVKASQIIFGGGGGGSVVVFVVFGFGFLCVVIVLFLFVFCSYFVWVFGGMDIFLTIAVIIKMSNTSLEMLILFLLLFIN